MSDKISDSLLVTIRKYFWIVHLVFIVVIAYLTAETAASVLERSLDTLPHGEWEDLKVHPDRDSRSFAYYESVMERNIFNSQAVYRNGEEENNEPEPASLDLLLKGTVVGDKEESLAIIRDQSNRSVDLYHVGDEVAGATLQKIRRGYVILECDDDRMKLDLQDIKTASYSRPSRRRSRSPGAGIVKRGRDRFEVPATVVDNAISDMGQLMRQARIKPHRKNGSIDGFKIYRIKRRSLFRKIGLRNGDIIHRINGMDLRGPEQGLQAFEELRSARNIQLDITRRGKKRSLNYTIK